MVRFCEIIRDVPVSRLSSTILWIEEAREIKTGTMTYDNAIPRVPRERNSIFVAVPIRNVDCVPAISEWGEDLFFFFFWKENRIADAFGSLIVLIVRKMDERWAKQGVKLISCYFINYWC